MKFIRVNMTDQSIIESEVPEQYKGLGGRGLTSIMINAEVPPTCDPLGPENKLIFAPGLLSGTNMINTSRISIGAKSPLTGTIKEANSGGKIAACMGKLGITALVVEGQAPEGSLFTLTVDKEGNVALQDASQYKGMRTYELCARLLDTAGARNTIACIGPAGEFKMGSASIQTTDVDDRPCRAAGRGGLGAVMGAKGLKAVVISTEGRNPDALSDPDGFKEAARTFAQEIRKNPFTGKVLPRFGTASTMGATVSLGALPSYNATQGAFDGWEKINGEALVKTIEARGGKVQHMGCAQCVVQCSNEYVDKDGKYVTSSLEYETMWSFGSMIGVDDLDVIAQLDFMCDDIGLDTINTGVAVAVAMDAGHKSFGDGKAAMEMVEQIAQGTELGMILGNGPEAVGKHFNHHRVPAVKGQSIAAYDPRGLQGNGVTYATSTMGADHTAGNMLGLYLARKLDPLAADGQVDGSRNNQIDMAAIDSVGFCLLAAMGMTSAEAVGALHKMIGIKLGAAQFGPEEYNAMGKRVLKEEREFNTKAGFTSKDDRLPEFFYKEPLPPHNKTFVVTDEDLDSFYNF